MFLLLLCLLYVYIFLSNYLLLIQLIIKFPFIVVLILLIKLYFRYKMRMCCKIAVFFFSLIREEHLYISTGIHYARIIILIFFLCLST